MAGYLSGGLAIAIVAGIVWTCGGTLFPEAREGAPTQLIVYGFSILAEPLRQDIFPLFQESWRAERGRDVDFLDSFAGSGTVANQIINGTPAHVALLSHPGDADRIVDAGRATRPWREGPNSGIVNHTAMVIQVRPGNPRRIRAFGDLGRRGIEIVHPDPQTSGGAKWAILAEFAEPLMLARAQELKPQPDAGFVQLRAIWRNIVAQAQSARAAKTTFDTGVGDALVTYEVEALLDEENAPGHTEMVVPEATILCDHPVVVVDRNVDPEEREVVDAFVRFLFTEEAQRAFVRHGFRSIYPALDAANARLRPLPHAYTVDELGGWASADRDIVDQVWKGRVLAEARR